MHRDGHVGAALVGFAPIGVTLSAGGAVGLAVLGAATSVALAMVPDYDMRIPFVAHRGVTHTLVFAVGVGLAVGAAAGALETAGGPAVRESLATVGVSAAAAGSFGYLVGTVAVLSHLAADALTPAGVPLLWPLSDRRFSLGLCRADDVLANYALLVAGALATLAWAWPAIRFAG